jgi:hypothetical protein
MPLGIFRGRCLRDLRAAGQAAQAHSARTHSYSFLVYSEALRVCHELCRLLHDIVRVDLAAGHKVHYLVDNVQFDLYGGGLDQSFVLEGELGHGFLNQIIVNRD